MDKPSVAVVTRTRDRPAMLARARASIAAQTFRDLVWVVVNDGGDPDPVERESAAARAEGLRVVVLHHADSRGMEAASNAGVGAADSLYVAIHDDDDSWHSEFLARTTAFLDAHPRFAGVVTHATQVVEDMRDGVPVALDRFLLTGHLRAIHLADVAAANQFPPISFLFRRDVYDSVGGFDETMPVLGDWAFNLRVLLQGDIAVLPAPLACYHVRLQRQGSSANSVIASRDLHHLHESLLRNRLLRADIHAGVEGIGFLMAMARLQQRRRPKWNAWTRRVASSVRVALARRWSWLRPRIR